MSWYPQPTNATVGLTGIMNATNSGLAGQMGVVGANSVGLSLLIPLWFIIFMFLAAINAEAAFTVASFICLLISIFAMAMGILNVIVFAAFFLMTFAGLIAFYLHTRQ